MRQGYFCCNLHGLPQAGEIPLIFILFLLCFVWFCFTSICFVEWCVLFCFSIGFVSFLLLFCFLHCKVCSLHCNFMCCFIAMSVGCIAMPVLVLVKFRDPMLETPMFPVLTTSFSSRFVYVCFLGGPPRCW